MAWIYAQKLEVKPISLELHDNFEVIIGNGTIGLDRILQLSLVGDYRESGRERDRD